MLFLFLFLFLWSCSNAPSNGKHDAFYSFNIDDVCFLLPCQDYSVVDFEERVVDGFYDVYSLSTDQAFRGNMPSLKDLESNNGESDFEVVIVNRKIDPALVELMQIAHCFALDCPNTEISLLVQRLAELVTGHLGGPVRDANIMLENWLGRSMELRTSLHTTVLPIGSLKIGLSRHRALLFKVGSPVDIKYHF